MDELRPEYLEAVEAARSNGWLVPLFSVAPLTLAVCFVKRLHRGWLVGAVLIAMFSTWTSLFLYSEHIWQTMETHAVTNAEWHEVTADTGRLFGPILVGVPFSVVYTLVWLLVIATGNWGVRGVGALFRSQQSEADDTDYASYRQSLEDEYARLRGENS